VYEYVRKQHAVAEHAERTPFQCISITVEESMRGRGGALRLRTVRGRAGREAGTVCRRASWGQWGIEFLKKGHGGVIRGRGIVRY
jgi:hypothetical protein